MKISTQTILFLLGVSSVPAFAAYANEESSDSSKRILGSVNSILEDSEASHKRNVYTYDSPVERAKLKFINAPTNSNTARSNLCSNEARCLLPPHRNSVIKGTEREIYEQRLNSLNLQNPAQLYPSPYPQPILPQGYYPFVQVDSGFARFPPTQQGGPMPNFFPSTQGNYGQPPQWLFNQPAGNFNPYYGQQYPQTHQHDHDCQHRHPDHHHSIDSLDHSLKGNPKYTEVGHREKNFQGDRNGLGYGSGYGANYNDGYNRHED